jgi:hypothetical protein
MDNENNGIMGTQERRYEGEGKAKKITKTTKVRVLYWKVAGLRKKEQEFWEYVRQFEIVGLAETLVKERSWEK